ncbi:MAG: Telomerase reverse transcriptase [Paramarteilia canceri]
MNEQSICMKNILAFLTHIIDIKPELLGYGFMNSHIDKNLNQFMDSWCDKYVTTLDIYKCYDSFSHVRLINALRNIFGKLGGPFFVRSFFVFNCKSNKIYKKYQCYSVVNSENCSFEISIQNYLKTNLHLKSNDVVFIECSSHHYPDTDYWLEKISELICQSTFSCKEKFLIPIKGIPQGLSISPILCNLFIGAIENSFIKPFIDKSIHIIRYMDDYLISANDYSGIENTMVLIGQKFKLNHLKSRTYTPISYEPVVWCGVDLWFNKKLHVYELTKNIEKIITTNTRYWITFNLELKSLNDPCFIDKIKHYIKIYASQYTLSTVRSGCIGVKILTITVYVTTCLILQQSRLLYTINPNLKRENKDNNNAVKHVGSYFASMAIKYLNVINVENYQFKRRIVGLFEYSYIKNQKLNPSDMKHRVKILESCSNQATRLKYLFKD